MLRCKTIQYLPCLLLTSAFTAILFNSQKFCGNIFSFDTDENVYVGTNVYIYNAS